MNQILRLDDTLFGTGVGMCPSQLVIGKVMFHVHRYAFQVSALLSGFHFLRALQVITQGLFAWYWVRWQQAKIKTCSQISQCQKHNWEISYVISMFYEPFRDKRHKNRTFQTAGLRPNPKMSVQHGWREDPKLSWSETNRLPGGCSFAVSVMS